MKQHQIDLLPEDIFARSRAGARTGRLITLAILAGVIVMGAATQARIALGGAQNKLFSTQIRANQVLEIEQKSVLLRRERLQLKNTLERYRSIAYPLQISSILAAITNSMPDSMTLESLDFSAGAQRQNGGSRRRTRINPDETPARVLIGEITGFARTDQDIATLVETLSHTPPLKQVTLDFSRTRTVRERLAREFRLSFRIDFEAVYQTNESSHSENLETATGESGESGGSGEPGVDDVH